MEIYSKASFLRQLAACQKHTFKLQCMENILVSTVVNTQNWKYKGFTVNEK